jgi:hypothetical protein
MRLVAHARSERAAAPEPDRATPRRAMARRSTALGGGSTYSSNRGLQ